jgi:hypothetical protein
MLSLDSPAWDAIPASPGGTGTLTARLLRNIRDGDESAYDELHHQVCHQFSAGAVAYVAVPHLVEIARSAGRRQQIRPLSIVGTVAAALLAYPESAAPIRDEWRFEFVAANQAALRIAAEALQSADGLDPADSKQLLATVAAFQGLKDLAVYLFIQADDMEMSCPACGEAIQY